MKTFVKYGLLTGLAGIIWNISCYSLVSWLNSCFFHSSIPATRIRAYSGLFSLLINILGIYMGLMEARRRNEGRISYRQAIKTGALIACVIGVCMAFFSFIYCAVINPGYADFMVNDVRTSLQNAGKSAEEISKKLEETRTEFSTPSQVMMALVGQTVVGCVASLIMGLFIKSKDKGK